MAEETENKQTVWPKEAKQASDFEFMMVGNEDDPIMKITKEKLNEIIVVQGESMPAIQGGATIATAVALPAGPVGQNRFFDASWGYWKYNDIVLKNPTGTEGIPEGNEGQLYWNGTLTIPLWSISKMQALPIQEGVDVINPLGNALPKEKAVADYSLPKTTLRAFPSNYEVDEIERPDLTLPDIITVDSKGNILTENWNIDYSMLQDYGMEDVDRPDLGGIVEVDKNNRILSSNSNTASTVKEIDSLFSKKFHEPAQVSEFTQTDTDVIRYDEIIGRWEEIRSKANYLYSYVTREEIGRSSTKDLAIFRYDFKPENPKVKVLLTTAMHGSEKVYIKLLPLFFKSLVEGWYLDPLLEWIRFNVHFIVIPVLSPSCTEGLTPLSGGGRRVHETTPINVSWTKTGNIATVSFQLVDFPDTGGRLDGSTYFSNPNIAGKTWVSLFDSSNSALGNKGYLIQSVIDARTITVQTDNSISGSGTAKLYVSVDINRNMQSLGDTSWNNYTPSTVMTAYPNDYVSNPNDNKGTKPFSLSESIVLKSLIDNNTDMLFFLDLHSGSGNNYLHWNTKVFSGQNSALDELKQHQAVFNSDGFSRVVEDLPNVPYSYKYCVNTIDKPGFTIEWEQVPTTISKSATDAMRWLNTAIISLIRNLK